MLSKFILMLVKCHSVSPLSLVMVEASLCPGHHRLVRPHEGHTPGVDNVAVVKGAPGRQLRCMYANWFTISYLGNSLGLLDGILSGKSCFRVFPSSLA